MKRDRLDWIMDGITGKSRWTLARASYAYSRMHGLSRLDALCGAVECLWRGR